MDTQNNFERGQKDEFEVTGSDVGQIQRIIIGHDNSGRGLLMGGLAPVLCACIGLPPPTRITYPLLVRVLSVSKSCPPLSQL